MQRPLAIALATVAATCLVLAAFTNKWLVSSSDQGELGFGLRSYHECLAGWDAAAEHTCVSTSNAEAVDKWRASERAGGPKLASGVFAPLGWITFVDLLITAAGLLVATAIALARTQPQWPIAPTTIALVGIILALITGCVFVATKPGPNGMVGVGLSFWLFGAGCVMGIAGSQLMAKVNRPPDPDLMADAMNPDDY